MSSHTVYHYKLSKTPFLSSATSIGTCLSRTIPHRLTLFRIIRLIATGRPSRLLLPLKTVPFDVSDKTCLNEYKSLRVTDRFEPFESSSEPELPDPPLSERDEGM